MKLKKIRDRIHCGDHQLVYLLSFLLPFLSMIVIFAGSQIYPFGDRCFLRTDLYHQYAPFFAELSRKLKEGGSLYYTWNIGMGTNFLSLIGYYLSSFFNFLILPVPQSHVIEFVSYLILIKMGLSGLSFAVFLTKRSKKADMKIPFFALFYAMSGYMAAYSWNIMWLDCVWLAPLILLGIEQLVFEKKYLLYIVTLAAAILSNYYIAIMLCMFCVLYFLIQLPSLIMKDEKQFLKTCLRFAASSLTAGALAAVILIPEIKALGLTASSDINFPKEWTSYFSILEMAGRHLMNVETECGLDHWPNIYCGVAILLCLPFYYRSRRIRLCDKISKTALLFFMLFSFSVNVPNFIWHGFHYPNSLPCRQSFLYIALILLMCYEGIQELDDISEKMIGIAFAVGAGFIILCQKVIDDDAFSMGSIWFSLVFVGIYTVMLVLYRKKRFQISILYVAVLVLVTSEAMVNMATTSVSTVSRSEYMNYTDSYGELIQKVEELDPDFYRFEKINRKTKNDGAFVGYPSLSTFSSVSYGNVSDFYKQLGMESSMNAYSNNGITPLMNSLFAVKYILSTTNLQQSQLMTLFEQNEQCYVYENLYTLSAGFMLPKGFGLDWNTSSGNPIEVQNEFSTQNGCNPLFYQLYDCTESGSSMEIKVRETCHVFVKLDNRNIDNVKLDSNGTVKEFSHTKRGFLLDLGYVTPEDQVTLSTEDEETFRATAYYLEENNLIDLIRQLQKQQLSVTSHSDTVVEGTIDVTEDGLFFISIPYDPGWTLYVDGEKTSYYGFKDAFISCDLSAGSHTIRLEYRPDGLIPGLLISLLTGILLVGYEICRRRRRKAGEIVEHVEEAVFTEISNEEEFRDADCVDEAMQDADSEDESNRNAECKDEGNRNVTELQ
ncbi:MAG: YfhO family protein [Lachnospiraceae bacterium]|nr:YfhO family protein [Lachnospiraceae bacterium]